MTRDELAKHRNELANDVRTMHEILQLTLKQVKSKELNLSASLLREITTSMRTINTMYEEIEKLVDQQDDEQTPEEREAQEEWEAISPDLDNLSELYGTPH